MLSFKAARLVDSDPWGLICMIVKRELAQVKAVALRSLLEQCPWFWSRAHPWFHAQSPWEPERCPSPVQSESWEPESESWYSSSTWTPPEGWLSQLPPR